MNLLISKRMCSLKKCDLEPTILSASHSTAPHQNFEPSNNIPARSDSIQNQTFHVSQEGTTTLEKTM